MPLDVLLWIYEHTIINIMNFIYFIYVYERYLLDICTYALRCIDPQFYTTIVFGLLKNLPGNQYLTSKVPHKFGSDLWPWRLEPKHNMCLVQLQRVQDSGTRPPKRSTLARSLSDCCHLNDSWGRRNHLFRATHASKAEWSLGSIILFHWFDCVSAYSNERSLATWIERSSWDSSPF